jgi:outer membrane lipoprotein-sorting protein
MRKPVLAALVSFLLLPALARTAFAQTADEVVEKYLTALGGRDALGKLTSRKATGTITVATPGGTLSGPIDTYVKAPNKSRADIRLDLTAVGGAGVLDVSQVFDGTNGFSLSAMQGDADISGHQLENMRNNLFPTPLLRYKEAGFRLEVQPTEKVNGRDAIVLKATPKVGSPSRIFFDADTHLVMRTIITVDGQGGGDLEQIGDVSDYRVVDGVKVPFLVVNTNDTQTVTIRLTKVEHNVAIDNAMFVKK